MKPIQQIPTQKDIEESHELIKSMIHRTPILTSSSINQLKGCKIFFKCENFQKIGAFKMRGASNAARRLNPHELKKGLATHSSGNHAQAVAKSAQFLGIPSFIVMPDIAPKVKVEATKGYGAIITRSGATIESREAALQKVLEKTEATFIHPYDHYDVIAGQATVAKELMEDQTDLDIILAPVGGGGLLSGTALSAHYWNPEIKVIGAEPKAVDDAYQSLQAGKILKNTTIDTVADGLRTNLGPKTFEIIQKHIDEIITVSEASIVRAMRLIWERMKIIIEPSCAVPLAAVMTEPEKFEGKKVGIILTGGNVDLDNLPFSIS